MKQYFSDIFLSTILVLSLICTMATQLWNGGIKILKSQVSILLKYDGNYYNSEEDNMVGKKKYQFSLSMIIPTKLDIFLIIHFRTHPASFSKLPFGEISFERYSLQHILFYNQNRKYYEKYYSTIIANLANRSSSTPFEI